MKKGEKDINFCPCLESFGGFLVDQEKIRFPSVMEFRNEWVNYKSEVERV